MKAHLLYRSSSFRAALALAKILPRTAFRCLASMIGIFYWAFFPHYRRIIASNLSRVFPNDPARVRALTRRTFTNFARTLADYCSLANAQPKQLDDVFSEMRGMEHLEEALQRGQGAILVTAHLGNWELGGIATALRGIPLRVVTAEEPTPELHALRENYRAACKIGTITLGDGQFSFLAALEALRQNHALAMLIDRPTASAVEVTFFGTPLPFAAAPVALAQATGVPILVAFCTLGSDGRYCAHIEPPLALDGADGGRESLARNTQKLATMFERAIREYPDQWFNFKPLWK